MFYHFKGTITAEDYALILEKMMQRLMIVFSGAMLIFTFINIMMYRSQWLMSLLMGVAVLLLGNFFLRWQLKHRFLKNFQPQKLDMYVTEEQLRAQMTVRNVIILSDRVYFFQAKNQVTIFKKDMLENQGQWEDFVTMARKFVPQKRKK